MVRLKMYLNVKLIYCWTVKIEICLVNFLVLITYMKVKAKVKSLSHI